MLSLAAAARRTPIAFRVVATRRSLSSVTTLSDLDAVEKFTQLNSKCVLYYTATWCGPCKAIKPVYEQMAQDNPTIALGKVDVDDNPDAAAEAEVDAVPTFVAFHNNATVGSFAGANQGQLSEMVAKLKEK